MLLQQVLLLHLLDSDWWKSSVSRGYIGKSSSSRKETGDSGRDATVHLLQQHSAAEEKRQAGGCRGAGAFSSGGSSRPRRREAPREAAAGRHERRNSSHQRSLCTRRGRATPSSNFKEEINAKKLSFYAPLQNNIFHLLETMHYKSRL